jgi:hypothetical protein
MDGVRVLALLAAVVLAAPWNPLIYVPDGQTYAEHIAEGEAIIAEVRAYAIAHCDEPYMPSCAVVK